MTHSRHFWHRHECTFAMTDPSSIYNGHSCGMGGMYRLGLTRQYGHNVAAGYSRIVSAVAAALTSVKSMMLSGCVVFLSTAFPGLRRRA